MVLESVADLQNEFSELDRVWREWLFGDLDESQALHLLWRAEMCLQERLQGETPQLIEQALLTKAQVLPFLNAMVTAIGTLRESNLNSQNQFVRCREFYKHLPANCLEFDSNSGMLAVPRPGSTVPSP